jgi:ribosomal protein S18 acetylase RimI-like enzyme
MTVDNVEIVLLDLNDTTHQRALVELLDHYARDDAGGGQPLSEATRRTLVPRLRQQAHYLGLLAFERGVAVGLANAFFGFSTFAALPLLNLHDLVVHASARRRGVGGQLIARLEAIARQRGCCKLTLEVLSENRAARSVYEAVGFAGYALRPALGVALFMEKKLPVEGTPIPTE